jgi:hypothetical protein
LQEFKGLNGLGDLVNELEEYKKERYIIENVKVKKKWNENGKVKI